MRASFLVLGPLLARFGHARVSTPGRLRHRRAARRPAPRRPRAAWARGSASRDGYVEAEADRLRGAKIVLDFPSVGATQQLMMAAALAEGTTDHRERGARAGDRLPRARARADGRDGRGRGHVARSRIEGRPALARRASTTVIPDRIEAGTFMVAAAITGGSVRVRGARADHLEAFIAKLREAGVAVVESEGGVRVEAQRARSRAVDVKTMPYPGFPTDLQAQFMALMTRADGHQHDHRDDLREPLHARAGAGPHGRRHPRRRQPRDRARAGGAVGRAGDGDRPARQRLPRPRRARGARARRACRASTTSTAATSASRRSSRALGADIRRETAPRVSGAARPRLHRRHAARARGGSPGSSRAATRRARASRRAVRRIVAAVRARRRPRAARASRGASTACASRPPTCACRPTALAAAYARPAGGACGATSRLAARRIRAFHLRQRERSWSLPRRERRAPRPADPARSTASASTCPAGARPIRRRC